MSCFTRRRRSHDQLALKEAGRDVGMGGWDDAGYYEEEAAKDEFIQGTLEGISKDGVRGYFGSYGDAIDDRVLSSIDQAEQLLGSDFPQPAVILATTAIELIVRYFLIHPLIQAAFLSEEWADLLTERVATGRTADDRNLVCTENLNPDVVVMKSAKDRM